MTNWEEIKNILSDIFTTIDKNESRLQELVKINKDPMGNGDRSMAAQELAFANDCLDRIEVKSSELRGKCTKKDINGRRTKNFAKFKKEVNKWYSHDRTTSN